MTPIVEDPDGATPLDPDELEGLKARHVTTRSQLDQLEQANVQDGLRWLDRRRNRDVLTEKFMLELHRRLFGDVWKWAGQLRQTEKNIGVDPAQISMQLRLLLDDARYWAERGTYVPLEAAARFHHRMVQIHLFPNGNGRHGRIAADAYITSYFGHEAVDWTAGYDLQAMNPRREQYIAALRAADAGDYSLMLKCVGL